MKWNIQLELASSIGPTTVKDANFFAENQKK